MKLLADENIERELVAALREAGFDVADVKEQFPGVDDDEVLLLAKKTDTVVLTNDKDFGELVFRQGLESLGVILLRLFDLPLAYRIKIVIHSIRTHDEDLKNSFTVVSENSVRIRKNL